MKGMPQAKVQFRSSGAKSPGFPDKIRAAQDIAADLHLDDAQSTKGRRPKGKAKDQLKAIASA